MFDDEFDDVDEVLKDLNAVQPHPQKQPNPVKTRRFSPIKTILSHTLTALSTLGIMMWASPDFRSNKQVAGSQSFADLVPKVESREEIPIPEKPIDVPPPLRVEIPYQRPARPSCFPTKYDVMRRYESDLFTYKDQIERRGATEKGMSLYFGNRYEGVRLGYLRNSKNPPEEFTAACEKEAMDRASCTSENCQLRP